MNILDSTASRATRRCTMRWLSGALLAGATLVCATAFADVPGRVGRVSFLQGDVQSYSETEPEWKVAYANEPITSHNSVFVGDGGRAEISVGSTTFAMEGGSQVDIQQLDDNTFNANVVRGRVSMQVRRFDPNDQYNVAAPGAEFALLQPGRYRIDALDDGTGITVFNGRASVEGDNPLTIAAGNAVRIVANAQDPNGPPTIAAASPSPVALDDWVLGREQRFVASQAERYVSPNMTGYEDLDANGRWASEPDVGPVWYPTNDVRADWAPYRYGRWAYVAPWGYTWIDDAPWGFAPFHYGRWLEVGGRWGWTPGAYVARPAYAPALVGFYGGANFSASFSIGAGPAVGWYPLAPWERFSPQYAHNTTYINQVNNITIVNAPSRFGGRDGGWNREHGATVVPRDAFASQRSISRVAIQAPRDAFVRAAPVNAAELPRPAQVPGAVRRGPDIPNGNARPEFRAPREFARQEPVRDGRPADAGRVPQGARPAEALRPPQAPMDNRTVERGTLPSNIQRLPEAGRAPVAPVAPPTPSAPVARPEIQQPRGPNVPNFNREGRPAAQPIAPAAAPSAANPNPVGPNVDRLGPRQQAAQRGEGEAAQRAREQAVERPAGAAQPAPQAPAQQAERQQQFERQQQQQQAQRQQQQQAQQQQAQQQQQQQQQAERQQQVERQQQQQARQQQQQVQQQQAERQQQQQQAQRQQQQQAQQQQQVERQQAERQQQQQVQQVQRQQQAQQQAERQPQRPVPAPQARPEARPAEAKPDAAPADRGLPRQDR